ncbi:tetratricopeptide repeat protein [Psychrobacter immobilis]|uniref:tetratricopeptide repeat protein n=1 Tax=Psychrobacter immobilis TaxID=498 RepID=UPI001918A91C|nr:tetratricopeptide repeat protein [Psychrobacter immobilis]
MVSSIQQSVSVKQDIISTAKENTLANTVLAASALIGMMSLSACQTVPITATSTTPAQTMPATQRQETAAPSSVTNVKPATQAPIIDHRGYGEGDDNDEKNDYPIQSDAPSGPSSATNPLTQQTPVYTAPNSPSSPVFSQPDAVIITPSRDDYIISEPSIPSHNDLLERARQNSQQRSQQAATNNSDLPAFRNLMQTGIGQLKSGKLTNAESSFTRAQRLAPKSSAVYFYLAQVALKKNQPRKAEAMARRGLSVSQDANRRRALWQIILQSGQAQGNSRVINEAKQALR